MERWFTERKDPNGRKLVKAILRLEDVDQTWPGFVKNTLKCHGMNGNNAFPPQRHYRSKANLPHVESYQAYYDSTARRAIENQFARDMRAFGYSFDGGAGAPGPEVFGFDFKPSE